MNSNQPLVSIAIPCYEMGGKGVKYLNFGLSKILIQDYPNIEVIISDHSKDDKIEKCVKKWNQLLNIKYIKNTYKRGSSSANLNIALKHCTGDLIKILFQDDYLLEPNSLSIQVNCFIENNAEWLATGCGHSRDHIFFEDSFLPQYNNSIIEGHNTISSPSVIMVKNQDLELFDENLIWLMDCEYYRRMHDKFGPPTICNYVTVINYLHPDQVSNTLANDKVREDELKYVRKKYP